MKKYYFIFEKIIFPENLFSAWDEFKRGKTNRADVLEFDFKREEKIFALQRELQNKAYQHSPYSSFRICDPKPRQIHKATVRDRLVHHAVFRILNQVFEPSFIAHSFSCRIGKGNHRGVLALAGFLRKASHNNSWPCFVLKCDVRKFFASVNHDILKKIIRQKVKDEKALWLVDEIIDSYCEKNWIPAGVYPECSGRGMTQNNIISERERVKRVWRVARFAKASLRLACQLAI